MKLGFNLLRFDNWSHFRPLLNPVLQREPWWRGTWAQREYATDVLLSGVTYRSMLTSDESLEPGVYHVEGRGVTVHGHNVQPMGQDLYAIGSGNVWLEVVGIGEQPPEVRIDSHEGCKVHPRLTELAGGGYRYMQWCGAFSTHTNWDPAEHPSSAHLSYEETITDDPHDYHKYRGVAPQYIRQMPGDKHLCIPLMVASDLDSTQRWVEARWDGNGQLTLEVSNEIWLVNWPQSRVAHEWGSRLRLHDDPNVARMAFVAMLSRRIHDRFQDVPNIDVVLGQQNAWHWPLDRMSWRNNDPVSRQILEDAQTCGRVTVAPYYFNAPCDDTVEAYVESMQRPLEDLARWVEMGERDGFEVDIYEFGPHNDFAKNRSQSTELARSIPIYLEKVNKIVKPDARAYWYALAGADPWGATPSLDVAGLKLQAILEYKNAKA